MTKANDLKQSYLREQHHNRASSLQNMFVLSLAWSASVCVAILLITVHLADASKLTLAEAQLSVNCSAFMQPIKQKRDACLKSSGEHEIDLCVYFASDYEFVVPFLAHHLSLGAKHIIIYNNDDKVAWYRHPAVMCMVAEEMVLIQPWFGEKELMRGLNHCYRKAIPGLRGNPHEKNKDALKTVWGANFDIDELLVLHKHQCMAHLLKTVEAPSLALNWAFFVPEFPLSDFGRTGNLGMMPKRDYDLHGVVLPHDKLLRRMYENPHIKTVNRLSCVESWHNEHCPSFTADCPFGGRPKDPDNHTIACQPWTPWIDNHYPIAQLNHYWTLSLSDYLRKIHRGKGGSYSKTNGESYRNTAEFFSHAKPNKQPFVDDITLIQRYGDFYADLKKRCPSCFDLSFYHLTE